MRPLILASVFLLTGLLLAGPRALRAEEAESASSPDRVAALAERRAGVQALIDELGQRLDDLEKSMDAEERGELDRRRARPSKKAKPKKTDEAKKAAEEEKAAGDETPGAETADGAPPKEEGPGNEDEGMDPAETAILEIAGTYEVDVEAFAQGMEDMLREQMAGEDMPEAFVDSLIEQMRASLETFNLTFKLDKDLTWTATSLRGDEEQTASGTWACDGDEVTLLQTHENGEESENPTTFVGTYDREEGVLTLQAEPDDDAEAAIDFPLLLRRVPDDDR